MLAPVPIQIKVWTTPKPDAESPRENEDRFWISGYRAGELFEHPVAIALADGASDGLFTREWAREVARASASNRPRELDALASVVDSAAEEWYGRTRTVQLPWFLEARRTHPVATALLCLEILPERTWNALAAGDTCFFQVREDQGTICSFPLTRFSDFGATPALISVEITGDSRNAQIPNLDQTRNNWEPGDIFYVMTDALAAWFLRETENGRAPWRWLDDIRDDSDFRNRIRTLREAGRLRGDDTTLIQIRMGEPETRVRESTGALA